MPFWCISLLHFRKYKLPMSHIIPFPKKNDPSSAPDFPPGRHVLAVYPGTTALYKATVVNSHRKVNNPVVSPLARIVILIGVCQLGWKLMKGIGMTLTHAKGTNVFVGLFHGLCWLAQRHADWHSIGLYHVRKVSACLHAVKQSLPLPLYFIVI